MIIDSDTKVAMIFICIAIVITIAVVVAEMIRDRRD